MKVAILQGQDQLNKQIQRSLQAHQINGDLIHKIDNRVLLAYDFLVLSSEQKPKIPNRVLEQIVLQKRIVLVYVHHQSNIGSLYNLVNDPFFLPVYKANMIETLPSILITIFKWQKEVLALSRELEKATRGLEDTKNTLKAKRLLMGKGMSEDDAHNWIQKVAMDRRCKKSDIVNLIIKEKIDID